MSEPIRRCIICGIRESKKKMFRLAVKDSYVVLDQEKKVTGRGRYCCQNQKCMNVFSNYTKRLSAIFRVDVAGLNEDLSSIFGSKE